MLIATVLKFHYKVFDISSLVKALCKVKCFYLLLRILQPLVTNFKLHFQV